MKHWQGKKEFKFRVYHFSGKIGVTVNSLYIRPMKNKWASCSTKGNFNFNEELLSLEKVIGDYVIVHELLHLRVPNHGPVWKSLMYAYLGDYSIIEDKLKRTLTKKSKFMATQKRHRDAGTGRYVTKKYADKHPKTTVKETDKVPKRKKK